MSGRMTRVLNGASSFLGSLGAGLQGLIPALRSKDGTYGTQRMQSAQLDQERRARYPRD